MNASIATLTAAEAAVVAGVSMREVHPVINERILPESFYDIREARAFSSDACVFNAFYEDPFLLPQSESGPGGTRRAVCRSEPTAGETQAARCAARRHKGNLVSSQAAVRSAVTKLLIDECLSSRPIAFQVLGVTHPACFSLADSKSSELYTSLICD